MAASPLNPHSAAFAFVPNSSRTASNFNPRPYAYSESPTPQLPGIYFHAKPYAHPPPPPARPSLLPPFDLAKSPPIPQPARRPPHPSTANVITLHPGVVTPTGHVLNPVKLPPHGKYSSLPPSLAPPPRPATPPSPPTIPLPPEPTPTPTQALPSLPSTPKSPPPALTKSWASLLRSPAGSPSSIVSASTSASPSTSASTATTATTKKSLQEILSGVELTSLAPKIVPRGLVNSGNMCFANTILQCLVFSAPFWNLVSLIKRFSVGDLNGRTPSLDAVILFLEEFHEVKKVDEPRSTFKPTLSNSTSTASTSSFSDAIASTSTSPDPSTPTSSIATLPLSDWSEPFVPEQVYESLKNNSRFEALTRGHQEDAEEFLGFFLETLHEEILIVIDGADRKKNALKDAEDEVRRKKVASDEGADSWLEVGAKGRTAVTRTTETRESPITKIFGGQIRSVLRCPSQKDSITLEPYQRLQLDIQPDNVKTIEHALLNLTVPESLPDFVTRSGLRVEATKQVFLETFPPVLILHLKRLIYDNVGGVQKSGKIVGYGLELEIAAEVVAPGMRKGGRVRYQLYAVVYHHGKSATGGHYTVAVRPHSTSNSWIHIDDTHISPISPNEVAISVSPRSSYNNAYYDGDKAAYLLFYNLLPPGAPPTTMGTSPSVNGMLSGVGGRSGVVGMKP